MCIRDRVTLLCCSRYSLCIIAYLPSGSSGSVGNEMWIRDRDKDDTLLGEMKELDGGVYQMPKPLQKNRFRK